MSPNGLPPKQLHCPCGNVFTSTQRSNWCQSCGKKLFYDPKDERKSRWTRLYIQALIVIVIGFSAYLFIEMILTPMLRLQNGG